MYMFHQLPQSMTVLPYHYICPVLFCTRKTDTFRQTHVPSFFLLHVNVHCSLVKEDLIKLFADPTVLQQELDWRAIDNYGRQEEGVASAVQRDILDTF